MYDYELWWEWHTSSNMAVFFFFHQLTQEEVPQTALWMCLCHEVQVQSPLSYTEQCCSVSHMQHQMKHTHGHFHAVTKFQLTEVNLWPSVDLWESRTRHFCPKDNWETWEEMLSESTLRCPMLTSVYLCNSWTYEGGPPVICPHMAFFNFIFFLSSAITAKNVSWMSNMVRMRPRELKTKTPEMQKREFLAKKMKPIEPNKSWFLNHKLWPGHEN